MEPSGWRQKPSPTVQVPDARATSQVTDPARLPQVERAAQRLIVPLQRTGIVPSAASSFATCATHRT
jgi:hypothetical protein